MASPTIRDPIQDQLITPQNAALLIIDYQPIQVTSVASMDRQQMVVNITSVARLANLYRLPIVLSTVNVKTGKNQATIKQIKQVLPESPELDRTTINAWEDKEFYEAVKATKRKKLLIAGLWTEACLCFPALDALKEGFEVYPMIDAVGGTSLKAHEAAVMRMQQAGARPMSWVQMACELQRDWNRQETAGQFAEILFAVEGH